MITQLSIAFLLFNQDAAQSIPAAQAPVNCNANSPDCCWVTRIFQMMGKTINGSAFSAHKACCKSNGVGGLPGVYCDLGGEGKVLSIQWWHQDLKGHIPSALGKVKSLQRL